MTAKSVPLGFDSQGKQLEIAVFKGFLKPFEHLPRLPQAKIDDGDVTCRNLSSGVLQLRQDPLNPGDAARQRM